MPKSIPKLSGAQVKNLFAGRMSDTTAKILNLFWDTDITGWNVDFSVGRNCLRTVPLGHRIVIGESWHNPADSFSQMVESLLAEVDSDFKHSFWGETSVRIAALAAYIGQLIAEGFVSEENPLDISVVMGDFSAAISAWYAWKIGLPIHNIILCCHDNSVLWELLHYGQLRTDAICNASLLSEADILIPEGLEHLIYLAGGVGAVMQYVCCIREGKPYIPEEGVLSRLKDGFYVSVISGKRVRQTVFSAWSTQKYRMSPYTALAYAGVQDYRVNTSSNSPCLVLSERSFAVDESISRDLLHLPDEIFEK